MKLFLIFVSILAASILTISLHSKQNSSIASRLHQKFTAISLSASRNSESRPSSPSSDLNSRPSSLPSQTESSALATRTLIINNKKYNIATRDGKDIEAITQTILPAQLNDIRDTVLSPTENSTRRHAYLYFLTQIKSTGARSLFEIVKAEVPEFSLQNDPHSDASNRRNLELSLRIAALEALDHLASQDPQVSQYLQQLERTQAETAQANTLMSYLTSISNSGLANNNPGKLHRVLNAILKENETL